MKITKQELVKVIKEELEAVMGEDQEAFLGEAVKPLGKDFQRSALRKFAFLLTDHSKQR